MLHNNSKELVCLKAVWSCLLTKRSAKIHCFHIPQCKRRQLPFTLLTRNDWKLYNWNTINCCLYFCNAVLVKKCCSKWVTLKKARHKQEYQTHESTNIYLRTVTICIQTVFFYCDINFPIMAAVLTANRRDDKVKWKKFLTSKSCYLNTVNLFHFHYYDSHFVMSVNESNKGQVGQAPSTPSYNF